MDNDTVPILSWQGTIAASDRVLPLLSQDGPCCLLRQSRYSEALVKHRPPPGQVPAHPAACNETQRGRAASRRRDHRLGRTKRRESGIRRRSEVSWLDGLVFVSSDRLRQEWAQGERLSRISGSR